MHLPPGGAAQGYCDLWRSGFLCDAILSHTATFDQHRCSNGIPVHRLALAAASGYFRARFLGAGAAMSEGRALNASGQVVVELPEHFGHEDLRIVLQAIYELTIEVCML